jgi:hypothetical protein
MDNPRLWYPHLQHSSAWGNPIRSPVKNEACFKQHVSGQEPDGSGAFRARAEGPCAACAGGVSRKFCRLGWFLMGYDPAAYPSQG